MNYADEVLKLLDERRNVLISGPPGTGKSMLLSEVSALFENRGHGSTPRYQPGAQVPIPSSASPNLPGAIGSSSNRKVFRSVLHQSSKYRDFLTGVMPDVRTGAAPGQFRIIQGVLYRASEYAKQDDHAALLIIDEINRGPTVQVFGGAIVAIEGEKRLADNGTPTAKTQFFDLVNPADGELTEYAFPSRLYILAAMNQADVSVEPLDVAFLRRWIPFSLEPSEKALRTYFGLPERSSGAELPETPSSKNDVLEAAVRAFESINRRITLGRGPEFRIGHGVLMVWDKMPTEIDEALEHVSIAWRSMKNHIDEAFFGDMRGIGIVLNADRGIANNPYSLEETSFGDAPRTLINGPQKVARAQVYSLLLALAKAED